MYEEEINEKERKSNRMLSIYSRLMNGRIITKSEEAERFDVSEKSIQRDIQSIRDFLDDQAAKDGIPNNLVYDRQKKGYVIDQPDNLKLTNDEILAICKILLASRAFSKTEMNSILTKLIDCCVPKKNQKLVNNLLLNERHHYMELRNKHSFLGKMMILGNAIESHLVIEFDYKGIQGSTIKHRSVEPLAIMFSEFYFYLVGQLRGIDKKAAFADPDDSFPTIYRMDRMDNIKVTKMHFEAPYRNRFEEGEYRKRIQFMFGGKLRRVKFEYSGYSVDAGLDRLPTAKIISEKDGKYTIQAEVYGDGIDMWFRMQGNNIKVIST